MENTTFLMAEGVLKNYLNEKITLNNELVFEVDGTNLVELELEKRQSMGDIISKTLIVVKILHRLMALKFDMLCDGTKEEPVLVGSGYIYETVARDLDDYNPSDILNMITMMSDENGMMMLSATEYDTLFKLMKDVDATGLYSLSNIMFELEHKMISSDDIEKGIKQLYIIMAHNDNLLANFSCQGHVEPMVTNMTEDGKATIEYKLDEPSIMIDYNTTIDMDKCIRESVDYLKENDHVFKKIHDTLMSGKVALEVRKTRSISKKTWDERVMLTFMYAEKTEGTWLLKGPIDIMPGLYQTHGMMVCYLTKLCTELADRAK